jgi:hypothetical protein
MGGSGLVLTFDYGSLSSSCRVVRLTSFSRVNSAMRGSSISFCSERVSLGWFLASARSYAYLHDVTSAKGLQVNLEQGWQFQHCFHTEQS